jgi:hypothetical protein
MIKVFDEILFWTFVVCGVFVLFSFPLHDFKFDRPTLIAGLIGQAALWTQRELQRETRAIRRELELEKIRKRWEWDNRQVQTSK